MQKGITLRQWLPLIGLTFSAFVFNTSEFMPIGLLTDIAGTFSLTEAQAGIMISVYAWAVMILSLPLMMAASRIEFKKLLLGVIALFSLGQFLSAAAPSYLVLVLARLVVACAHAVFWSIAAVCASRLVDVRVDVRHSALAVSMVATGTSIAMIFGLPIGRAIGLLVGWRMTFTIVGVVAAATVVYLMACFPKMPAGEPFTLAQLPLLLKNRVLMGIYATTILFATGYYTGYSYIEPFLQQVGCMPDALITLMLTVFGIAGLVGSVAMTRFYDRRRALFLAGSCAGVAAGLLLMRFTASAPVAFGAACAVWGMFATTFSIAYQSEIIRCCDKDSSTVAMSIFSGIFNLGIGSGTALGGAVVSGVGIGFIGFVGGAIALGSLLLSVLTVLRPLAAAGAPAAGSRDA